MTKIFSLFLFLSLCIIGQAQSDGPVTYTVQVVALSDALAVQDLHRDLVAQGYPAYIVEAGDADVPLYRLRVGAFASRETALVFSEALNSLLTDYTPSIAVLDSVAVDTPRLQAALLARYPYAQGITTVQVVPWGADGSSRALRFQQSYANQWYQAFYQVLEPELVALPFPAWRAVTANNGYINRIYSLDLWPENFAQLSQSEVLEYQNTLLSYIATELAMSAQEVAESYVFYDEARGIPYLVLGEGRNLLTGDTIFYPALGYPAETLGQAGPQMVWLDRGADEGLPESLVHPAFNLQIMPGVQLTEATLPDPASLQLDGDGWRALPDAGFISLTDGTNQWKAALGYPLYAYGEFLLTHYGNEVLLYWITTFNP